MLAVATVLTRSGLASPPVSLAAAILLVPVVAGLTLGVEFVTAALLGDGRRGGAGAAWAGEVVAMLHNFLLAGPLFGNRSLRSEDGTRIPVVLVHGYLCNPAAWRPLARHLARRGHPFETVALDPPFALIDSHVAAIDAAVAAAGSGGTRPVVLIGHSMGGLAIRAWLRARSDAPVAGVVTLGTPHRGTRTARLPGPPNVRQMRRGSAWLARLEADEQHRPRPPFTVILTLNDNIVYPQAGQVMPDARVVALAGIGHLALLRDARVRRILDEELDRFEDRVLGEERTADARAGQARITGSPGAGLR